MTSSKETGSEEETIVVFMSDNGGNSFTNIEPNKPLRYILDF